MRNAIRTICLLFAGLLLAGQLKAHDVVWWENPTGLVPSNPMVFYYPNELSGQFHVAPSSGEPCTVAVSASSTSTLVNAQVLPPNPANTVDILVQILRAPSNHLETATITGEWHATGLPAGQGCDATNPNPFSVTISVSDQMPKWGFKLNSMANWVDIDTGFNCALQSARCLPGPWVNIGSGQKFWVNNDVPVRFFQRSRMLGGFVSGTVTDSSGSLLSGINLGLLYGGPSTTTDSTGSFSFFPRLPWGMNVISISNSAGASVNIPVPATNNTAVDFKVAMVTAPPVTNACNCTPWCAIGFGTLPGGTTPVYYAGGANGPGSGAANCGQVQVTVTPPGGTPLPITPGSTRSQNSGPNPAAGTWTVTTIVCGQTKTATLTVP